MGGLVLWFVDVNVGGLDKLSTTTVINLEESYTVCMLTN